MTLAQFKHWGTWPARAVAIGLIVVGAYLAISAQLTVRPPMADDPEIALAVSGLIITQTIYGAALAVLGLVSAGLTWLVRHRSRAAAIAGVIGCFFVAGFTVAYGLANALEGMALAAALIIAACLLIAAASALVGKSPFDNEAISHG